MGNQRLYVHIRWKRAGNLLSVAIYLLRCSRDRCAAPTDRCFCRIRRFRAHRHKREDSKCQQQTQFYVGKGVRQRIVDRLFFFFFHFLHIILDILFRHACSFPFPSLLECFHGLFMTADADKFLIVFLADELHLFMTHRTPCVGETGNPLFISTLSVLADEHLTLFAIDSQQPLAALGTVLVSQVVVAEGALAAFDLFRKLCCVGTDLLHKCILPHFSCRYIRQLHLPLSRKLRFLQILRYQIKKLFCFARHVDFIFLFLNEEGTEQFIDNVCPGGDGAETAGLLQSLRRVFILALHIFHRILHGLQERTFGKSCRRLGLALGLFQGRAAQPLAFRPRRKHGFFFAVLIREHFLISHAKRYISFHLKRLSAAVHGHRRLFIFISRIQHRQKTPRHQIKNLPFIHRELRQNHRLFCRDDSVMIGHLFVVDKRWSGLNFSFQNRIGVSPVRAHGHRRHPLPKRLRHIGSQIPGISSRIGQHLMMLIKALHQIQSLLGRESEALVGVPLQSCQVIQTVKMRTLLCLFDGNHPAVAVFCPVIGLISRLFRENRGAIAALFLPCKCNSLPPGLQAIIRLRHKMPDLFLSGRDHGKGRSLHPAAGKLRIIFAGQRPGGIDTHQPVGLRPCYCRPVKIIVFLCIFQMSESLPDGLICHRGNPQPPERFLAAGFHQNPPRHQLTFPTGIGGDDHLRDIFAFHLALHRLKLSSGLRNHHQLQMLRHHRQVFHPPGLKLLVVALRVRQRHQMPKPPGDHVFIALYIILCLFFAAQNPGDISCHRRFLC